MSNLAEKMETFPTVKGDPCKDCGNPWWFTRLEGFQCTTCGAVVIKPELRAQKNFEEGVVAHLLSVGVVS